MFPDSYPGLDPQTVHEFAVRLGAIALDTSPQLTKTVLNGIPGHLLEWGASEPELAERINGKSEQDKLKFLASLVVKEALSKVFVFSCGLTAGQIGPEFDELLKAEGRGVFGMYGKDQTMDRGYQPAKTAVSLFDARGNLIKEVPPDEDVRRSVGFMQTIGTNIDVLAKPEDAQYVRDCFVGQVLHQELAHANLSETYGKLSEDDRIEFVASHAEELAHVGVVSAGFPSIVWSLYAIERQQDPTLPAIEELIDRELIVTLMRETNFCARLGDDVGDADMDRGLTRMNKLSINPFNQYDPAFADALFQLGGLKGKAARGMHHAMKHFRDNDSKDQSQHTAVAISILTDHARKTVGIAQDRVAGLPNQRLRRGGAMIINYAQRVTEIVIVNTMGDQKLADMKIGGV